MKKPTLRDIAGRADVSVSTVSRYLNGEMPLKSETEARIQEAMRAMDFSSGDIAARRMISSRSVMRGVVGVIVPSTNNAYWGAAIEEIVRRAAHFELETLVASHLDSSVRHARYIEMFQAGMVAGIISTTYFGGSDVFHQAVNQGIACLVFDDIVKADFPIDCVLLDNYSGAYQATSLLVHNGHRQIAFIGGLTELNSTRERQRGWREALARGGIDATEQLLLAGSFSEEFGQAALSHLLDCKIRPTAVFAVSDAVAIGLITAARQQGIAIPDDLSIIGFGDLPIAAKMTPRLTTMKAPVTSMAANAVRLLVERMANPHRPQTQLVSPVVLTQGETVARLSAKLDSL